MRRGWHSTGLDYDAITECHSDRRVVVVVDKGCIVGPPVCCNRRTQATVIMDSDDNNINFRTSHMPHAFCVAVRYEVTDNIVVTVLFIATNVSLHILIMPFTSRTIPSHIYVCFRCLNYGTMTYENVSKLWKKNVMVTVDGSRAYNGGLVESY